MKIKYVLVLSVNDISGCNYLGGMSLLFLFFFKWSLTKFNFRKWNNIVGYFKYPTWKFFSITRNDFFQYFTVGASDISTRKDFGDKYFRTLFTWIEFNYEFHKHYNKYLLQNFMVTYS